jgi:hypothetical protein
MVHSFVALTWRQKKPAEEVKPFPASKRETTCSCGDVVLATNTVLQNLDFFLAE